MSNNTNDAYIEILADWLDGMKEDLNGSEIKEVERLITTGQLEEAYEALQTLENIHADDLDRLSSTGPTNE